MQSQKNHMKHYKKRNNKSSKVTAIIVITIVFGKEVAINYESMLCNFTR